jgi:hypothetical protein
MGGEGSVCLRRAVEVVKKICVLCLLAFVSACSSGIDRESVVGTYHANHGHGEEALELLANGRYVLTYSAPGQPVLRNESTWEIENDADGSAALSFKDYVFGYRNNVRPGTSRPGWWHVRIEKSWTGHVELNVDPDLGFYYIK